MASICEWMYFCRTAKHPRAPKIRVSHVSDICDIQTLKVALTVVVRVIVVPLISFWMYEDCHIL